MPGFIIAGWVKAPEHRLIAYHADARSDADQTLRDWLGEQTIAEWRDLFDASPTELADLLSYVRVPGAQAVSQILEGAPLELAITAPSDAVAESTEARLSPQPNVSPPAPIEVVTADGVVGTIRPSDHDDVALLMNLGIPLVVRVAPGAVEPAVTIALAPEPDLDA